MSKRSILGNHYACRTSQEAVVRQLSATSAFLAATVFAFSCVECDGSDEGQSRTCASPIVQGQAVSKSFRSASRLRTRAGEMHGDAWRDNAYHHL